MNCDKCGRMVIAGENAAIYDSLLHNKPTIATSGWARHLFPVFENGKQVCVGSPSRLQYIEGQPRDMRKEGYNGGMPASEREAHPYDPTYLERRRWAFEELKRRHPKIAS